MANVRIKDLSTDSALSAGDYVVVDSASEGSRKFDLGTELTSLKEDIENISGISDDVKAALLQIASKVAYIDDDGADYYQDLYDALYPPAALESITAVYTQSGTVYDTASLDDLKEDLVVTAHWDGQADSTVPSSSYTLSGTLAVGTSTITVSYGGKTDTFTVTVTQEPPYEFYDYIQGDGTAYIDTGLKASTYLGSYTHEIKVAHGASENERPIYGAREGWGNTNCRIIWQKNLGYSVALAGSATANYTTMVSESNYDPHVIKLGSDKKVYFDGEQISDYSSGSFGTITKTFNFLLFTQANGQSGSGYFAIDGGYASAPSKCRIYYFKVFDSNNDLVAYMQPAKRKSDDAVGMYDSVRDTFYQNPRGSGALTLGNEE